MENYLELEMIKIKPIRDKNIYHKLIYREIKAMLDRALFDSLMSIAETSTIDNSTFKELLTALRKGEVAYSNGYFTGRFNSAIGLQLRSMGATFDRRKKAYYLTEDKIPAEAKIAIARGIADTQEKINAVKRKLDSFQKSGSVPNINFSKQVEGITIDLDRQFRTTVPKDIGLPMTTTDMQKQAIREGYTENLNLYIQKMIIESTERLRGKIVEHVEEGGRAADLVSLIQAQRGVTDRHALFLAKQETSILVSTYRDSRYREAGIDKYIWSTSHDSRVRHDHKILDGKRFKFNEPPITDSATGARNNPGYDYGCRCIAIPLLEDDNPVKYSK